MTSGNTLKEANTSGVVGVRAARLNSRVLVCVAVNRSDQLTVGTPLALRCVTSVKNQKETCDDDNNHNNNTTYVQ